MENKRLKPNFMFSQGELMQLGDKAESLATQDQAQLLSYGVDAAFITNIADTTQQLKDFPTDEELEGKAMHYNQLKTETSETVKSGIRTMMVKVKQVFGENSGKFIRFGTTGMNEMDDLKLIKCGFRVVRMAGLFLLQLAVKGVTQAMIDALETDVKNYDRAYDDQQDAKFLRKSFTHERLLLANALYGQISELFDYGKDYWSTRNQARYKDYIIYEVPQAKKKNNKKKIVEENKS
jgi:hypothetical protein